MGPFFICRLFCESEEDDALMFDELIRPTFKVFNSSAQNLRQSKFHASAGSRNNYSSSFSSNVPSPAPNGQVPSPAPEDQVSEGFFPRTFFLGHSFLGHLFTGHLFGG